MGTVLSAGDTLARIQKGLRMVTVPFPHLSGLVAAARVSIDERVPTVGVFASGRMVANPAFVARLKDSELVFVLAHEMLHLALRTHDRARGSDRVQFNYAHDYIINDMLRVELGFQEIPAGGLDMPGAREKSAEQIVIEMRKNAAKMPAKTRVFDGEATTVKRLFESGAGNKHKKDARNEGGNADEAGDVLEAALEKQWFPNEVAGQSAQAEAVKELAARALSLAKAMGAMKGMRGFDAGGDTQTVDALRGLYRPPWETALQRWLESVAPGERTFTRPSRRGEACVDGVLPGRRREGWMLNMVLDTSGSMADEIPRALGAIADFCDAAGVDQVRLVQCDTAVTADDCVDPSQLEKFQVSGYGGSDLTPGMEHLAHDPAVRTVIVITDGDIDYPRAAPPYHVLWVLSQTASAAFNPSYGRVVRMDALGR